MLFSKTILVTLTTLLLAFVDISTATPQPSLTRPRAACTSPVLRKEWGSATATEKTSYINAVLCLATKPSIIGHTGTSLYDDFSFVHNALNLHIHGVAQFLPWHRYFVHVYETALQDCGYTGVAMYWDWAANSAAPASSSVWSPVDGFGGNGNLTLSDPFTHCITDGPFVNLRPNYYQNDTHPHCITRGFAPAHPEANIPEMIGDQYSEAVVAQITAIPNFVDFHGALECCPHGAVHAGVAFSGEDMGPTTSPNDPIFFLHHTQVDRVWWLWQQASPSNRSTDFAGTEYGDVPATLQDIMPMMGLAADREVADFMTTTTEDLCYMYE